MTESILQNLVRIGTVTDVNASKHTARVKFKDTGITSGWLYVIQHYQAALDIDPDGGHTHTIRDTYSGGGSASTVADHDHEGSVVTWWMPKINDTVLCLYIAAFNADGFILGGIK